MMASGKHGATGAGLRKKAGRSRRASAGLIVTWPLALILVLAPPLIFPSAAEASAGEGRIVVELQGSSSTSSHKGLTISGTNNVTRQAYKYEYERWGTDFHYVLSGLSLPAYAVEFSFFEPVYQPGQRVFSVTANDDPHPLRGLNDLDIAAKVGINAAYQVTALGVPSPGGRMDLHFAASSKEATICNIRLIAAGQTAVEINVMETRHLSSLPMRFVNAEGQDASEVVLGRFGSRSMVNAVPQLLAWRQSPLGTWTADLSELVLAFRDAQGDIRCLPFTDRYPVFSAIDQELTLTGVSYACQDASLPFEATVTFTAPFYPKDVKLSTAPIFYVDIEVSGDAGEFILARPHKDDNTGADAPVALGGSFSGFKYKTKYHYADESRNDSLSGINGVTFWEALAVGDPTDVELKYADISDTSWIWDSPRGYPLPYGHKVYTFEPRGYSGLRWDFSGGGDRLSAVMASHTDQKVLAVRKDEDSPNVLHSFLYRDPAGPGLTSVEEVVDYALGSERESILKKTAFFDGVLSEAYVSPLPRSARDLAACALQSFIINAWWVSSAGEEWFSVWEGDCFFHSTIDVEYNDAWFYLCFWPELLGRLLREWPGFEKSNAQGRYLSHDMGWMNSVTGMAYTHDMPVEENADYVLLLYSYWKTTGDDALMKDLFARAKLYTRFIFNCDTDADGLPDLNTANTIDQGSPAVQDARNQTYLGVKALAAYRAAAEMARAQAFLDEPFIAACEQRVRLINLTLEQKMWLGDHFAVCSDPAISRAEREAYSIYPSNGLLYLLAAGQDSGLTAENLERFRQDIVTAADATARLYGSVHTSVSNENEWVSQNMWRDALAYWLGADGWPQGQEKRTDGYWDLERYYATKKNGGFWDVILYRDYLLIGASEAAGLGFSGPDAATAYLGGERAEAGGARGAYALDAHYWQLLGYYPRGTAFFSCLSAMGRLRLDRVSGLLLYDPAHTPGRVPVFTCADWAAAAEEEHIPVLEFDASGDLLSVKNDGLLPAGIAPSQYRPLTGLEARPFSCSPGSSGPRRQVNVSYDVPSGSSVKKALVMSGPQVIRELTPGPSGLTWDGLDADGSPVPDGTYTVYLETEPSDPAVHTPPSAVQVGVNTVLPSPANTWYLAEGYTGSNDTGGEFDTWVLVQNPGDAAAAVTATFMQPGGANTERSYYLPPHSRFTILVDDILPASEVSTFIASDRPVVAERAVYFNGGLAGHDTIGVNTPAQEWYLAEGFTGADFDEWVLIQNPGEAGASLKIQFQTRDQGVLDRAYYVPPRSRFTIHVDDILPNAEVSTHVSSNRPVVVERAQYLNSMRSGTCSIAARSPSHTWFFAEGYTAGGFEEWLLVQNPWDSPTLVDISFMQADGTNATMQFTVPARSRYTVPVQEVLPGTEVSARISSTLPVVAERAMYWKNRSDGHATLGAPTPDYTWFFAEGYTGDGFEEWLLVQNPWDDVATVRFDFMLPGGDTESHTVKVDGRSRFTLNVGGKLGATEVSIKLTSDLPVVGERAMYFRERSGGHCSIGAIE